ncbi:erythromycin esterase family protein [Actinoplanes sp. LDG1-06]|uniref:Erythromycin esterase family protein n=1 Tax=Paractinoplanes ovalisporus TaxID=2810368 RepID=A0ABS2AF77_9ACTN|nr:erythromycin esterase family protein [Actinoplanes ovalisporus]MBM2618482.1 erythromycin esterase family protein [Actinoplanes ovalisporus]
METDDLARLEDLIGDARVVAIGESAHFVREYTALRHDLIRHFGFTTVAMESGFSEGLAVRDWIRDGVGDPAPDGLTYRFGQSAEMRGLLEHLRATRSDFWGLDLPGDLGSPGPALDHLDRRAPELRETLSHVRRLTAKFASAYTIPAFTAYREMPLIDRDALTLALAEAGTRFDATPHRRSDDTAINRHELSLLVLWDQMLRAQVAAVEGSARHAGLNIRDGAMARTAEWILGRTPGRLLVLAANSHIQRRHPAFEVLGSHLSAMLGDDYRAIGVTALTGRVATRRLAPEAPAMAETVLVELPAPDEGSIELEGPGLHDTRGSKADKIRLLDSYAVGPVAEAFDAVVCLPVSTPTEQALWAGGR